MGTERPTCCLAGVHTCHILLVQEDGAEIGAAGGQHSFVSIHVYPLHNEGGVTQLLLLLMGLLLLQIFLRVKLHGIARVMMGMFSDGCCGKTQAVQQ